MVISCAEGVPLPAQHTPVLSGDLDATGRGAGMAVNLLAAARQRGQDLSEQGSWYCDLGQLESVVATMTHDLGAGLDQLYTKRVTNFDFGSKGGTATR